MLDPMAGLLEGLIEIWNRILSHLSCTTHQGDASVGPVCISSLIDIDNIWNCKLAPNFIK
jgi:hypothetical protein